MKLCIFILLPLFLCALSPALFSMDQLPDDVPFHYDLEQTDLFWKAAMKGDLKTMKELYPANLRIGLNLQQQLKDSYVSTALDWAIKNNNKDMVEWLVVHKAWSFRHTRVQFAEIYPNLKQSYDGRKSYHLWEYSHKNEVKVVSELLDDFGDLISVNLIRAQKTALDSAVQHKNEAMAKLLFTQAAKWGETPMLCSVTPEEFRTVFPRLWHLTPDALRENKLLERIPQASTHPQPTELTKRNLAMTNVVEKIAQDNLLSLQVIGDLMPFLLPELSNRWPQDESKQRELTKIINELLASPVDELRSKGQKAYEVRIRELLDLIQSCLQGSYTSREQEINLFRQEKLKLEEKLVDSEKWGTEDIIKWLKGAWAYFDLDGDFDENNANLREQLEDQCIDGSSLFFLTRNDFISLGIQEKFADIAIEEIQKLKIAQDIIPSKCQLYGVSNYAVLYDDDVEAGSIKHSSVNSVLLSLSNLIDYYCANRRISIEKGRKFFADFKEKILKEISTSEHAAGVFCVNIWVCPDELGSNIYFYSMLNRALREDNPEALKIAWPIIRGLNENISLGFKWPKKGLLYRGAALKIKDAMNYYKEGCRFKCPQYLATSTKNMIAKIFSNLKNDDQGAGDLITVIFIIHLNEMEKENYKQVRQLRDIKDTRLHEEEYLFLPYSGFEVKEPVRSGGDGSPCEIHLLALPANYTGLRELPTKEWN